MHAGAPQIASVIKCHAYRHGAFLRHGMRLMRLHIQRKQKT